MRILHLIHSEGIYGAERILLYLAREQQRSGLEPIVGSIRDPGTAQTQFEALACSWGLPTVAMRVAPRLSRATVHGLLRSTRELAPDVVHSHGYKANLFLGWLPRRTRGPMLATLHGWTSTQLLSALWLYERLDRIALRSMDAVVVVARGMLHLRALRGIRRSRLHIVENGIPPLEQRLADLEAADSIPLLEEAIGFTRRKPTLVAIGRLSPEKGFELLLDAFCRARSAQFDAQLLIVGEGSLRDRLEQRIFNLALSDCVRLTGYIEGADRLLEHAAGFVMSSATEGMPLVLLEALQWPVPILATTVGAIPEILADGRRGLLVPPNDVGAMAAGLQRVLGAGAGRVSSGAVPARERHTSAAMAQHYLDVYRTIHQGR